MKSHLIFSILIIFCVQYECVKNLLKTNNKLKTNTTDVDSNNNEKEAVNENHSETTIREKENFIENNKKGLVLIKSRPEVPFITDSEDTIQNTGFIIDLEKGLVASNRKIARFSPALIKIQFFDGSIKNGRIIYTDTMVPFGLIQIDNSNWAKEKSKYKELKLGSANDEDFKVDAPLYLIGTSSEGTYIVKKGMIINSNRNYSNRYGSLFQSSFDRVSNLWGSPVINNRGEVWGVHVISSDTTSYELKVDYIKNILKQIKANGKISRGDIGVHLDLIILGIAKTNYKLSNQNAEEILANIKNSGGPPEIMIISTITPGSPSEKILKAGDIIYKVNNNIIGNDFLKFDNILNENVGNEITVTVSRNGEIITLNIKVNNTQDDKISKYISFAGAYFHDISDSVKSYLFTNIEGVYLTYTSVGSPFSKISAKNSGSKNNYILTSINSKQIKSIDSLVDYFKSNCELESIYVEGVDYNAFSNKMTSQSVDLDFNSLLQVYTLNPENLKWEVDSLDLNKYCSETKPGSIKRNKSGHKMVRLSSNINDEEPIKLTIKTDKNLREGLSHNIINDDNKKRVISDYSFKSNNDFNTNSTSVEKNLVDILDDKFNLNAIKIKNSTLILEKDKKIEESKKKINDKDKNILDHLSVLQKFRMQ